MKVRTGLVGYGLAGAYIHAPLIRASGRLSLDVVATSRTKEVATREKGARAVADVAKMFDDPALDLVVIASPNDTHFPLAKAALDAGKHVVVDKPFVLTVAEADELIDLAARAGRLLTVFHNRRWDGDFIAVERMLAERRLGDIALYEARWDRFRPKPKLGWRETSSPGGGLLYDLGPHLIDQALRLFGRPDAIVADIAMQRTGVLVDDYFELTLHYGAMRAILSASTLVAAKRPRFAVHGSLGSFATTELDPQEAALRAGEQPGTPGFAERMPDLSGVLTDAEGEARRIPISPGSYVDFYDAVAAAVIDGAPPPVDPMDARDGLHILDLARRSAQEGVRIAL